ncbi:MAG: GlsB/YeaQ/YmgE family stress response membrane protein [Hyphomicrobiaceae bacterium]|nr:GlsB/YeaQ/YmgE family stress response membrane protein [Hyphomicrobiaceae bacterium]
MDQVMVYLQNPWVVMALNGLIAGWLAGLLLGGGGLIRNLVVGIIGAVIGGVLVQMGVLALPPAVTDVTNAIPFGTQILVSTIGAIIVVILARIIAR